MQTIKNKNYLQKRAKSTNLSHKKNQFLPKFISIKTNLVKVIPPVILRNSFFKFFLTVKIITVYDTYYPEL